MIDLTQLLLVISIVLFAILIQQNVNNYNNYDKLIQYLIEKNKNNNYYQVTQDNKDWGSPSSFYYTAEKRVGKLDTAKLIFEADQYRFAMVSDMDLKSRDPNKFLWKSLFKSGTLVRTKDNTSDKKSGGKHKYNIIWDENIRTLTSKTATKNRSMELSALVRYRHWLLSFCDYTGMVYKILPQTSSVFQRHAIADGDGEQPKPMKIEWATVKDDLVWIGSNGKEWTNEKTGKVIHQNTLWVKTINANGKISNINWSMIYLALRTATNSTYPGYLWHEAVHWDPRAKHWIILPRKQSNTGYSPDDDEMRGTNLLIIANEDFTDIKVSKIGPIEKQYGFTAVRKVPGSNNLYLALKVKEVKDVTHSKICLFDLNGTM
jgi:soluble calcium-activated nucleotidase 1